MAPDLNSLPPSRSPSNSTSPMQTRPSMTMTGESSIINTPPSPHSPSLSSLQAAASINAGIRNSPDRNSPRFERRRSSLMMNLHLNEPTIPGPGELQASHGAGSGSSAMHMRNLENPQHHRAPSLGEMHQQLENEQEAQVNRLLQMIRTQQEQITSLQGANTSCPVESSSAVHSAAVSGPTTDAGTRSRTSSVGVSLNASHSNHGIPRSPHQRPISLSRQSSRMSGTGLRSGSQSPMLRPLSSAYDPHREEWMLGGARDEIAFYQAETQMLTRENQMLKQRIRELERQLSDHNPTPSGHSGLGIQPSHSPAAVSPLASPPEVPQPMQEQPQSAL